MNITLPYNESVDRMMRNVSDENPAIVLDFDKAIFEQVLHLFLAAPADLARPAWLDLTSVDTLCQSILRYAATLPTGAQRTSILLLSVVLLWQESAVCT